MQSETAIALEKSIAKWKKNAAALDWTEVSIGSKECDLCILFNNGDVEYEDLCEGCPVYEKIGKKHCTGTNFSDCHHCYHVWRNCDVNFIKPEYARECFVKEANIMIAFLESLRDE